MIFPIQTRVIVGILTFCFQKGDVMMLKNRCSPVLLALGMMVCVLCPVFAQEDDPMLPEERAALFDYDAKIDLQVEVIGTEERDGVTVQDITFVPIPDEAPVKAYIITPNDKAEQLAGILWGHWLGEKNSNRTQFLEEAVSLAREGVVSVLIDTPWANPEWYRQRSAKLDEDYESGVQQIIRFRRAMDLLLAQSNVDPERIAFVGHDYSGMYGMVASAVDNRASAYVFTAVAPSFYDWAFFRSKPKDEAAYRAENDVIEPMAYLPFITGDILFQFAGNDFYVKEDRRQLALDTAPASTKSILYEKADHAMDEPDIAEERDAWLREQLELEPAPSTK
jgi:dienelactone hydrolase